MIRSQIEFEIREPTGLRLGTYDIFMIRQKIYTGELQARCEYLDPQGSWAPLVSNPVFGEVIRLMNPEGAPVEAESGQKTAPRLAGWNSSATKGQPAEARTTAPPPAAPKAKKGLLSRFFGK